MSLVVGRLLNQFAAKFGLRLVRTRTTRVIPLHPSPPPAQVSLLSLTCDALSSTLGGTPTLIQIGAADGRCNDPVEAIVRSGRIQAVLVEPIPELYARLEESYRGIESVETINCAIGEHDGEMPLFRVATSGARAEILQLQLSSFRREHLLYHGVAPDEIATEVVPCLTLQSLVTRAKGKCDILQVDAEGYDDRIVMQALALPEPPSVIHFEHVHLNREQYLSLLHTMHAAGYDFAYSGMDTLALKGHPNWITEGEGMAYVA